MKSYKIIINKNVIDEIVGVYNYIYDVLGNKFAAENTVDKINNVISSLELLPERHRTIGVDELGNDVRSIWSGNYRIIYSVNDETSNVIIHHVVYGRRNIKF